MSHDNRQEDIDKIKGLGVGEDCLLNMFQDGGSRVVRVSHYCWELYVIPLYGGVEEFWDVYQEHKIVNLVDTVYDVLV